MFVTLLGPLPLPPGGGQHAAEAQLDAILGLQSEHGLEPLTVAGWVHPQRGALATWRAAAARTSALVKGVLTGPFSVGTDAGGVAGIAGRDGLVGVRAEVDALVAAGCRWIEIHEPAAVTIGTDADARSRFADMHRALTDGLDGVHLSLAITGGSADGAGIETILAGAYVSLAVDLIAGPDNWRLVTATPGDLGIVCGVIGPGPGGDPGPEVALWAAGYAAASAGRGMDRVGLASAGSLAGCTWQEASDRVRRLAAAARLASLPPDEVASRMDPRAVDIRSAGLGRYDPPSERPPLRRPG